MVKVTGLVIVPPLPVEEKFSTLAPTLKEVALTAPLKLAVPPMFCTVRVPTPEVVLPVMLAPTPEAVSSVRPNPAPVTAPRVMAPAAVVAWVFSVVAEPRVMAPRVSAVLEVVMMPLRVTVPPTELVFSPPL